MNITDRKNWELFKSFSPLERLDYLQASLLTRIDESEDDNAAAKLASCEIAAIQLSLDTKEDETEPFADDEGLESLPEQVED